MANDELYRSAAVKKLSAPERLDYLLPVTKPHYWIAGMGAVLLVLIALAWGFFGSMEVGLDAKGIYATTGYSSTYYAEDSGCISSFTSYIGGFIKKDEPMFYFRDKNNNLKSYNAPVTGMFIESEVAPGSNFKEGDPLVKIRAFVIENGVDPSTIVSETENYDKNAGYESYHKEVYAYVDYADIPKLSIGTEAKVYPLGYNFQECGFMTGRVIYINPYVLTKDMMKQYSPTSQVSEMLNSDREIVCVELYLAEDSESPNGYKWNKETGNDIVIHDGDTMNVVFTLEKIRPIDLLFKSQ